MVAAKTAQALTVAATFTALFLLALAAIVVFVSAVCATNRPACRDPMFNEGVTLLMLIMLALAAAFAAEMLIEAWAVKHLERMRWP